MKRLFGFCVEDRLREVRRARGVLFLDVFIVIRGVRDNGGLDEVGSNLGGGKCSCVGIISGICC